MSYTVQTPVSVRFHVSCGREFSDCNTVTWRKRAAPV